MPANSPYIKPHVIKYSQRINAADRTPAEIVLDEDTAALNEVMTPIREAKDQHISFMEVAAGERRLLEMYTQMLAMQHPDTPAKAIDVGTFTGSSAGALAKGMVNGGEVITCDIDPKNEEQAKRQIIAKRFWDTEKKDGNIHPHTTIEQILAPASDTMQKLLDKGHAGEYDIIFIDADKTGYNQYYEQAMKLLRPGGLIVLDNMLWSGKVAKRDIEPSTIALRNMNEKISLDPRVKRFLDEGEDGIFVVMKLPEKDVEKRTSFLLQVLKSDPTALMNKWIR